MPKTQNLYQDRGNHYYLVVARDRTTVVVTLSASGSFDALEDCEKYRNRSIIYSIGHKAKKYTHGIHLDKLLAGCVRQHTFRVSEAQQTIRIQFGFVVRELSNR